jgi:hypothetical protein
VPRTGGGGAKDVDAVAVNIHDADVRGGGGRKDVNDQAGHSNSNAAAADK